MAVTGRMTKESQGLLVEEVLEEGGRVRNIRIWMHVEVGGRTKDTV